MSWKADTAVTAALEREPRPQPGERVVVGMSGGVDSAVAAMLLCQQDFDVHGLYMHNWSDDGDPYCSSAQDFHDAEQTAEQLGIVLHRIDFSHEYRQRVFEHFLAELRAGRTPNPDVACNREIKFGLCRAYAERLGGRWFATGHYARLQCAADGPALYKAHDLQKDQSYFLHAVPRHQFAHVLFPLGDLTKDDVRRRARAAGLSVAGKPDSTGICFIGERPFSEFLQRFLPQQPGPIETSDGELLGTHQGLAFHTLGQRAGLGIGGRRHRDGTPWFVAQKDPARNALIVMQSAEYSVLRSRGVRLRELNWLASPADSGSEVLVKLRYRQPDQAARVEHRSEPELQLSFSEPQRAVTPGQYGVLYREDRCLGGGVIDQTL